MASVQTPTANQASNIFQSVFKPGSLKPTLRNARSTNHTEALLSDVKLALIDDISKMLGIGDEDFIFGTENTTRVGQPFRHIGKLSLPITQIREPNGEDYRSQIEKYRNLRIWQQIPEWQSKFGASTLKKLLARVADQLMTDYIVWAYAGQYSEDTELHLDCWVQYVFARSMSQIIWRATHPGSAILESVEFNSNPTAVTSWREIAASKFGALRVNELFDIVVEWDQTRPAIHDLRQFATHPWTRAYLSANFTNALVSRLLHPGASTIEILQIYISTIRAFRMLDPRGVLLDRVTRKLRRYLKDRDDTIKVLVLGLLSDPPQETEIAMAATTTEYQTEDKVLADIAQELHRSGSANARIDEGELDWNNMEWVPDPVDAAPDYMRSKNTDVVGSLISLFDSKDVFVKELQICLADRLLQNKPDFQLEFRVIEHLKIRLGDITLQGCEVMMRDITDSRKVDKVIRKDQDLGEDAMETGDDRPEFHSKILSRLFWPTPLEQSFKVPQSVKEQQEQYAKGFESLKQSRTLTWINSIGHVEVELELTDRVITEEVLPWQASVIYNFHDNSDTNANPTRRTVASIATDLEMSVPLVRSACIFWTSKRVLVEIAKDEYEVLEKVPTDIGLNQSGAATSATITNNDATLLAAAEAAAANAAAQAAREAEEAEREQKMAIYHQFVKSMLTNQGAMPLARIAMMLNIVVPGGFPFSTEELREFLSGMIKDGVLEIGHGGNYKVVS